MKLRRLADGIKRPCTGLQTTLCICGTGFWDASKRDLYKVCDVHGICHTDGMLDRNQTTHVVVPFSINDMKICQEYARHILTSEKVSKAIEWGIPIVSIDFLLYTVGRACQSCCTLIPETLAPVSDPTTVYACPADCIPMVEKIDQYVEDTPSKYVANAEDSSSGQSTQQQEESSVPTSPVDESVKRRESTLQDNDAVIDWAGGYDYDVDPTQMSDVYGSQTPGMEAFHEEDLRNFASIKVTPLSPQVSESDHSSDLPSVSCLPDLTPPLPDCFIPGDLLLRAPKGNGVRKRHNITSRTSGMIEFTESMTFRHLEYMHLDTRHHIAVEIVDPDTRIKAVVKPLHFYRLLGQKWMMEFKRYFKAKDIGVDDTSNGLELYLSTKVEGGLPVHAFYGHKVEVHRIPRHKKGPMLHMESSDDSDPPYFYRYDYDVDNGRVLV